MLRTARSLLPYALAVAVGAVVVVWLVSVFRDSPVRYVSMLDGKPVDSPKGSKCVEIAAVSKRSLKDDSLLPLLVLGVGSLLTVAIASWNDAAARGRSRWTLGVGVAVTAASVGLSLEAVSLNGLADVLLRWVAPLFVAALVAAAVLVRSPDEELSQRLTFPMIHAALVGLAVPAAVAWLTPTFETFVCL